MFTSPWGKSGNIPIWRVFILKMSYIWLCLNWLNVDMSVNWKWLLKDRPFALFYAILNKLKVDTPNATIKSEFKLKHQCFSTHCELFLLRFTKERLCMYCGMDWASTTTYLLTCTFGINLSASSFPSMHYMLYTVTNPMLIDTSSSTLYIFKLRLDFGWWWVMKWSEGWLVRAALNLCSLTHSFIHSFSAALCR